MYPNRLKPLRKKLGLSQEGAARRLGISWSMWNKIERGERLPSFRLVLKIADLFGCTVDEIFPHQPISAPSADPLEMASDGRA